MAISDMERNEGAGAECRTRSLAMVALAVIAIGSIACESSEPPRDEPVGHASQAIATATTPMGTARGLASATMLADGRVLVAGGRGTGTSTYLSTGEIYDPKTATWTASGSIGAARFGHRAVLLPSGCVLGVGGTAVPLGPQVQSLYGGCAGGAAIPNAPISLSASTPLIVLADGRVFVSGGSPMAVALYAPATNTWSTAAAPLFTHDQGASAALLADGSVLVAGGGTSSAERYVPSSDTWVAVPSMGSGRGYAAAVAISKGVLILGGGSTPTTSELYSPSTNTWSAIAPMPSAIVPTFAAVLPSGSVVAVGGRYGFYDPAADRWSMPDLSQQPSGAIALTGDGSVIIAGGSVASTTASTTAILIRQNKLGESCATGGECTSGFCADGVCCNEACAGQCGTCSSTASVGTCVAVSGAPLGGRAACSGAGTCGAVCDGSDKALCHYPAAKMCSAPTCVAGTATSAGGCDGAGSCATTTKACAPFACGAAACNTSCTTSADCSSSAFCNGSKCEPRAANGGTCAVDDGCTSGHCADGLCCDTACGGQCEACNVTGRVGTCWPVSGGPHGARPACDKGTDVCSAKVCDGKNPSACDGFPSATTTCGSAQCTSAGYIETATCDGAGSCSKPSPKSCGAYACGSGGCKTGCATNDDCSTGFVCNGVACVPGTGATCSSDGLSSIARDGTITACGAYRCRADGTCGTNCGGTSDCSPGNACDTATSLCTTPPASDATGASGGCGVGGDAPASGMVVSVLGLALAGITRRRRGA